MDTETRSQWESGDPGRTKYLGRYSQVSPVARTTRTWPVKNRQTETVRLVTIGGYHNIYQPFHHSDYPWTNVKTTYPLLSRKYSSLTRERDQADECDKSQPKTSPRSPSPDEDPDAMVITGTREALSPDYELSPLMASNVNRRSAMAPLSSSQRRPPMTSSKRVPGRYFVSSAVTAFDVLPEVGRESTLSRCDTRLTTRTSPTRPQTRSLYIHTPGDSHVRSDKSQEALLQMCPRTPNTRSFTVRPNTRPARLDTPQARADIRAVRLDSQLNARSGVRSVKPSTPHKSSNVRLDTAHDQTDTSHRERTPALTIRGVPSSAYRGRVGNFWDLYDEQPDLFPVTFRDTDRINYSVFNETTEVKEVNKTKTACSMDSPHTNHQASIPTWRHKDFRGCLIGVGKALHTRD